MTDGVKIVQVTAWNTQAEDGVRRDCWWNIAAEQASIWAENNEGAEVSNAQILEMMNMIMSENNADVNTMLHPGDEVSIPDWAKLYNNSNTDATNKSTDNTNTKNDTESTQSTESSSNIEDAGNTENTTGTKNNTNAANESKTNDLSEADTNRLETSLPDVDLNNANISVNNKAGKDDMYGVANDSKIAYTVTSGDKEYEITYSKKENSTEYVETSRKITESDGTSTYYGTVYTSKNGGPTIEQTAVINYDSNGKRVNDSSYICDEPYSEKVSSGSKTDNTQNNLKNLEGEDRLNLNNYKDADGNIDKDALLTNLDTDIDEASLPESLKKEWEEAKTAWKNHINADSGYSELQAKYKELTAYKDTFAEIDNAIKIEGVTVSDNDLKNFPALKALTDPKEDFLKFKDCGCTDEQALALVKHNILNASKLYKEYNTIVEAKAGIDAMETANMPINKDYVKDITAASEFICPLLEIKSTDSNVVCILTPENFEKAGNEPNNYENYIKILDENTTKALNNKKITNTTEAVNYAVERGDIASKLDECNFSQDEYDQLPNLNEYMSSENCPINLKETYQQLRCYGKTHEEAMAVIDYDKKLICTAFYYENVLNNLPLETQTGDLLTSSQKILLSNIRPDALQYSSGGFCADNFIRANFMYNDYSNSLGRNIEQSYDYLNSISLDIQTVLNPVGTIYGKYSTDEKSGYPDLPIVEQLYNLACDHGMKNDKMVKKMEKMLSTIGTTKEEWRGQYTDKEMRDFLSRMNNGKIFENYNDVILEDGTKISYYEYLCSLFPDE